MGAVLVGPRIPIVAGLSPLLGFPTHAGATYNSRPKENVFAVQGYSIYQTLFSADVVSSLLWNALVTHASISGKSTYPLSFLTVPSNLL